MYDIEGIIAINICFIKGVLYGPETDFPHIMRVRLNTVMRNKTNITIRLIGAVAVLMGLRLLVPGLCSLQSLTAGMLRDYSMLLFLFMLIIQVLKVFAGSGLIFLKSWGRRLSIPVLTIELLVRLIGVINLWTYPLLHPDPQVIPPNAMVNIVSVWPGYIGIIIVFISLVTLLSKPFAGVFHHTKTIEATKYSA